jgi:hypothetical protein
LLEGEMHEEWGIQQRKYWERAGVQRINNTSTRKVIHLLLRTWRSF